MSFEIDGASLLVRVPGGATLASIERALAPEGLTLGVPAGDVTVAEWLARGAPGAPSGFLDPADHVVAGLSATLTTGRRVEVRPAPRRAVGPDLIALFVGANERFGAIDQAWIRVHVAGAPRVRDPLADDLDLDPPVASDEGELLDAMARELERS